MSSPEVRRLPAEAVEGSALTLQRVDDVHRGDRLALGMLRVSDGIANDVLEEDLQHTASLFVDQTRDALHSASTSQSTNGRLRDALNVVTEYLAMTLGTSLAESLTAFASPGHDYLLFSVSRHGIKSHPTDTAIYTDGRPAESGRRRKVRSHYSPWPDVIEGL